MKAISEKNVAGLSAVLSKMTQRMGLANYAESTITIYVRAARTLGVKLGKCPENVEQDELHEYLLEIKDRMSQSIPDRVRDRAGTQSYLGSSIAIVRCLICQSLSIRCRSLVGNNLFLLCLIRKS